MYVTTKGLVLRVCPYNDTDAMLTILTAELGRISAKVRGLRRKNSRLSAPCQLLSFAEFAICFVDSIAQILCFTHHAPA